MQLKDFLKKYSTIPNRFIDDFYGMFQLDTDIENKFKIDLDLVAKWLSCRKGNLKDTLIHSYEENIDFTIKKSPSFAQGGRPSLKILLTTDCFKRLCLLSKTKKAEEIRTY